MVTSDFVSDEEEAYFKKEPTEEEWHMDFMPTGYLPDSVYRELAWYGILQIQPLHHSSKHKVVAQLIWEHTLGRPHVIMENPPQSTQSAGKVSRQILAEEAAKWSREQRAAQEVLMENIKSGGNGLTVRTVISSTKKSIYIIQNGNYYECPHGSEPDLDAYRIQANMHERKCTFNKNSIPVSVDPCIEAEVTPIEFSFHEGWMFCLGNGERENNYFQNGTLDCGNKIKISVDDFLDKCAIDNNIVITFDYFGDEPRKDMMRNTTLCSSWDPCRISYLYRLEPPPGEMMPSFPTTPEDPCDTTVCPECLEGYNPEEGGAVIENSPFVEDVEDKVPPPGYGSDNEESEWIVSKEKPRYDKQFQALKPTNGKISGAVAKTEMEKSKLPFAVLAKIWKLSDIDKDGFLDDEEFALAMFLISVGVDGHELPDDLPANFVPPSKRN